MPTSIFETITNTFNISQSYFSSPVTCSTQISVFYLPFTIDKIFGTLGTAFQYKWKGIRYAHPHNEAVAQQAIHWARLAAQEEDPHNTTIIVMPNTNWYQDTSPYT